MNVDVHVDVDVDETLASRKAADNILLLARALALRHRLKTALAVAPIGLAAATILAALALATSRIVTPFLDAEWLLPAPAAGAVVAFAIAFAFARPDPTRLLLAADDAYASHDLLASAYSFASSGDVAGMTEDTVRAAGDPAARSMRFWPKGPPAGRGLIAAGSGLSLFAAAVMALPEPDNAAGDPGRKTDVIASTGRTGTEAPLMDPLHLAAAAASDRVTNQAYTISDAEVRRRALRLAEALRAFAYGRGSAASVIAAAASLAEAADQIALDPALLQAMSPELIEALKSDALTAPIADALKRKDFKLAASLLRSLLANASPEDLKRLGEKFKGYRLMGNFGKLEEDQRNRLSDAMKGAGAAREASDIAEKARRAEEPDEPGPRPGPRHDEQPARAGEGKGSGSPTPDDKIAISLRKEKDENPDAPLIGGKEVVEAGASKGPGAPGFKGMVRNYRTLMPEDVARVRLPAALRAMVEAYYDRLEARDGNHR